MAGTRFADWLYECVDSDQQGAGDCHVAPIPIRWGKRVMFCYPDRNVLIRYPHVAVAEVAFEAAMVRSDAAMLLAATDPEMAEAP